jgi:S-formylglutathione hydrolase FrmB
MMNSSEIGAQQWDCKALGRRWPFSISVPRDAPPENGWPLLMVLHGAGRTHRTVVDSPELHDLIGGMPMVTVFPDGALGWYVDSPIVAESKFQSMLRELLTRVRTDYPVSDMPADTIVCGWSMGGFGAVRFTEDFPEEVGTVASIIGLLDYPNPQYPPSDNYALPPVLGSELQYWRAINCTMGAERLRGKNIAIIAAKGAFDYRMNRCFHERLLTLGIAHDYAEIDGGHEWSSVATAFPLMLNFFRKNDAEREKRK